MGSSFHCLSFISILLVNSYLQEAHCTVFSVREHGTIRSGRRCFDSSLIWWGALTQSLAQSLSQAARETDLAVGWQSHNWHPYRHNHCRPKCLHYIHTQMHNNFFLRRQESTLIVGCANYDQLLCTSNTLWALCVRLNQPAAVHVKHLMSRVGQNHIYTVHIRYTWQGDHQIYGHIRCVYTVLANPTYEHCAYA